METYKERMQRCLRNKLYLVGLTLIVAASIISATISEKQIPVDYLKVFRLLPFFLVLIGIAIGNSIFGKVIFKTVDTNAKKGAILWSVIIGFGLGLFANSGIAAMFKLSLQPSEFPFSWIIIGVAGLCIGSFYLNLLGPNPKMQS